MKNTYTLGMFTLLLITLFSCLVNITFTFAAERHTTNWHTVAFEQPALLTAHNQWVINGSFAQWLSTQVQSTHQSTATTTTTSKSATTTQKSGGTTPPTTNASQAGEVRITAYTTGYGWPDNTPAGAAISNPVIHKTAGGTGTYVDPITLAVGHSITGSKDILDYPAGTKFYIPNLRKYFIVEDTCGDGNQPQNGPCHTGYQGHVWLDLWVGGQGLSSSGTLNCEDTITDLHAVIINPASNYTVTPGPVFSGTCATQFGEIVATL